MRFLALIAALAALWTGPAFAAGYNDFTGRWRNADAGTGAITRLRIRYDGAGLDVRAWGQCEPRDCDWGRVDAVAYGPSPAANPVTSATEIIAVYNPGFARKTLILTLRPGDRLSYAIYTTYPDGSRRRPYVTRGQMVRLSGGGWPGGGWPGDDDDGGPGGRVGITLFEHTNYDGGSRFINSDVPNLVALGWNDVASSLRVRGPDQWEVCEHVNYAGRCRVVSGDVPNLVPGGWNDVISSVRRYRGYEDPGGPGGPGEDELSFEEDCNNINPSLVEARFTGGEWKVVQGSNWLLSFGLRVVEAQRAANIIRHYRFTQQCFIGRGGNGMTYWKRGDRVPSGGIPGDDCNRVDPASVQARRFGGSWRLVDGTILLFDFGPRGDLARQAEELVRYYRLGEQCFVGRPNPPMTYWLSE